MIEEAGVGLTQLQAQLATLGGWRDPQIKQNFGLICPNNKWELLKAGLEISEVGTADSFLGFFF